MVLLHTNPGRNNSKSNSGFVLNAVCNQWMEQYHFYGAHYIILYVVWIMAMILIIPMTISNMFAISVFMRKEQMKTLSNLLLLHTALCDALFGCVALPLWSVHLGIIIHNQNYSCILMTLLSFFALSLPWMSFATTLLISVAKHMAILHPYFYHSKVRGRRRVFIIPIILFWLLIVLLQLTWFFTDIPLLQSAPFVIPLFCAYSIYVHIRISILVKKRRIVTLPLEVAKQMRVSDSTCGIHDNSKDVQTVKLTSLILASLCICYLPYFVLQIVAMAHGNNGYSYTATMHTTYPVVLLIGATKGLINPLLYYCQKQAIQPKDNRVRVRFTKTISISRITQKRFRESETLH